MNSSPKGRGSLTVFCRKTVFLLWHLVVQLALQSAFGSNTSELESLPEPEKVPYETGLNTWRQQHETRLRADDGWLTLAGLHWLEPGNTTIGSDSLSQVRLPSGAPRKVGTLHRDGSAVALTLEPGVVVTRGGKTFDGGKIRTDEAGKPDILALGAIRLIALKRGDRVALRVKDNESVERSRFAGLRWYPPDPAWRIKARFEPAPAGERLVMETIVGTRETVDSPGHVVFERDGVRYRLRAAREGDTLWFVFRDATAGKTTAPNARQLNTEMPSPDGTVVLDFNKAVNLPCAYTPFATCPLAPRENRLTLAITAGEKIYEARPSNAVSQPYP